MNEERKVQIREEAGCDDVGEGVALMADPPAHLVNAAAVLEDILNARDPGITYVVTVKGAD